MGRGEQRTGGTELAAEKRCELVPRIKHYSDLKIASTEEPGKKKLAPASPRAARGAGCAVGCHATSRKYRAALWFCTNGRERTGAMREGAGGGGKNAVSSQLTVVTFNDTLSSFSASC